MPKQENLNRRNVLKAMGAIGVSGAVVTGPASAQESDQENGEKVTSVNFSELDVSFIPNDRIETTEHHDFINFHNISEDSITFFGIRETDISMLERNEHVIVHMKYRSLPHNLTRKNYSSIPLFSEEGAAPSKGVSLSNSIQTPAIRIRKDDDMIAVNAKSQEMTVKSNNHNTMTGFRKPIETTLGESTEVKAKITAKNHGKLDVYIANKREGQ